MVEALDRLARAGYLWAVIGWYGLAKVPQNLDEPLLSLMGLVSGHSLKQLAAALGIASFLVALYRRLPDPESRLRISPPAERT